MKKTSKKKSAVPNFTKHPDRDRRVRQSERIARVLRVLSLIQSRARWNTKSIASELQCSERTVYRDLEVLEFAGVPWFYDETEECYRIRADFRFPTLTLTEDEVVGQVIATALSKAPGLGIGPGASPTTRKIAATSSEEIKQIVADASRLIEVFDLKLADHSLHHEIIKVVQVALLNGKMVVGGYESPYEPKRTRIKLHPYRLCLIKQAWYIIGRIDGEVDVKTFRVARFKTLRMLDENAVVPDEFDIRKHFGNAWAVYRGDKTYQVELRFEPDASKVVTETHWHPTQTVKQHKDGRATLYFTVDGLNEILHWILSWSGRVKVIEPAELKTLLVQTLEDALQMNSEA